MGKKTKNYYEISDLLVATAFSYSGIKLIKYYWKDNKLVFCFDNSEGKCDKVLTDLLNKKLTVNLATYIEIFRFLKALIYSTNKNVVIGEEEWKMGYIFLLMKDVLIVKIW